MKICIFYLGIVLALLCTNNPIWAQFPRYSPPAGRTMPNALNYFRSDTGLLDPYNTFVAPRRYLAQEIAGIENQQRLNYQQNQAEIASIRSSQAAPTGTGATFFNYSHYYSNSRNRR